MKTPSRAWLASTGLSSAFFILSCQQAIDRVQFSSNKKDSSHAALVPTDAPALPKGQLSTNFADSGSAPEKPDVLSLHREFLADGIRLGKPVPQYLVDMMGNYRLSSDLGPGILGVCTIDPNRNRRDAQFLLPQFWPREWPSLKQYKFTVYHELGHCLLEFGHYAKKDQSIMSAYSYSRKEVEGMEWDNLLKDLFDGKGLRKISEETQLIGNDGVITIYWRMNEDGTISEEYHSGH